MINFTGPQVRIFIEIFVQFYIKGRGGVFTNTYITGMLSWL